jgi:hypothetical protein
LNLPKLPFVSRDRYEEMKEELLRTRAELSTARLAHEKLWNWTVWRVGGGVAPDVTQLPEAYQPKPAPSAAASENKSSIPPTRRPGQARQDIAKFEVNAEREYRQSHPISEAQIATVAALNQAANEGMAQA